MFICLLPFDRAKLAALQPVTSLYAKLIEPVAMFYNGHINNTRL